MSVLIKGFEVPKDGCKDCAMVQRGKVFDTCPFLKQEVNGNVERGGKPNGCPIIEVPDTNVGDTISRQAVLDEISDYNNDFDYTTNELYDRIKRMSSVNPQPKTGRWLIVEDRTDWYDATYECSCCKREIIVPYEARDEVYIDYPYCHCGAKMVEPQESNDKCKNCEYYRNPDYTRCHECTAESEEV